MYKVLFIAVMTLVGSTTVNEENAGRFEWNQTSIDLGEIEKNSTQEAEFRFTNVGEAPLVITEAKASCGCTIAEFPKEAIGVGEQAAIRVAYDAKTAGVFQKTVKIKSNIQEEWIVLTLKGTVMDSNTGK
jgi:hypothetical protein